MIAFAATCTHLGGVAHRNSTERSWDCPCHGSRVATDGRVLSGPAPTPLAHEAADVPAPRPGRRRGM